jgi:DNA-binding response OmpR family regulator
MLVARDAEPPVAWGPLTDWLRLPADDRDIRARIDSLQLKADRPPAPVLDDYDVVWRGARWVALSPVEARVLAVLLARGSTVVSRRELNTACWKDGVASERAVDARLPRLRARIAPLGLSIRTIRSRGFLLEVHDPPE